MHRAPCTVHYSPWTALSFSSPALLLGAFSGESPTSQGGAALDPVAVIAVPWASLGPTGVAPGEGATAWLRGDRLLGSHPQAPLRYPLSLCASRHLVFPSPLVFSFEAGTTLGSLWIVLVVVGLLFLQTEEDVKITVTSL